MNPSKTLFGVAIALSALSFLVVAYFGLILVGLSMMDQEFAGADWIVVGFIGAVLATHIAGMSIYVRGLRMSMTETSKVRDLQVYAKGVWVALAILIVVILAWAVVVESIIVGVFIIAIAYTGLIIANTLGQLGLARFLRS